MRSLTIQQNQAVRVYLNNYDLKGSTVSLLLRVIGLANRVSVCTIFHNILRESKNISHKNINKRDSRAYDKLNYDKYKVMYFSRFRYSIIHTYNLRNHHLLHVNVFCDLGVIFEPNLTFNHHIQHIINKSSSILGFITRNCKDFKNHNTLKILNVLSQI